MPDLKLDMAEWEWRMVTLEDMPQSELEELKNAIRDDWYDKDKRAYWEWRIHDEAEFSRELKQLGREAVMRIKASVRLEGEK